jgi:hypothetical protein
MGPTFVPILSIVHFQLFWLFCKRNVLPLDVIKGKTQLEQHILLTDSSTDEHMVRCV